MNSVTATLFKEAAFTPLTAVLKSITTGVPTEVSDN
jgi:hypothetical protein